MKKRESKKDTAAATKRKYLLVGTITLLAFLAALAFDLRISLFVVSLGTPLLTTLMLWVTYLSTIVIAIFSTLVVYATDRKRLGALWASLLVTLTSVALLKVIVGRLRPFQLGFFVTNAPLSLIKESYGRWDFSFPSSHVATALAVLPFMPKKWRVPWIVFSVLVMFSRVYFGLHYLSDVIAGAAIGFVIATIIKAKMPKLLKGKLELIK